MPILASLGTANDRAFGFGDSSFKFAFGRVILSAPVSMEMLLVAGGGSGGGTGTEPYVRGGGGGAGGLIHQTTTVTAGTYDVVVGLGGTFGQPAGRSGQNTTAFGLVAIGGGGGSSNTTGNTASGGSGGGASGPSQFGAAGTSGQGYKGGDQLATGNVWGAGGGGGAGAAGGNAGNSTGGGNGGNGLQFDISGELLYYAGGGGGGEQTIGFPGLGGAGGGGKGGYAYPGTAGTDGLGGGGGGAGYGGSADNRPAGSGGSGVVILKYLTTEDSKVTLVNGEKATQGEYTICKFTKEYNSVIPDTDYTLPSVITDNAEIIYDVSNPDSYNASGTTWYDISGNDRHATWSAEPTLAGYNNNQYLSAGGGISFVIPEVFSPVVDFSYYILCENPFQARWFRDNNSQLVSTGWASGELSGSGKPLISWRSQGSGGFGSANETGGSLSVSGYVLLRCNIVGDGRNFSSSTMVGGQTASVNYNNTATRAQNFTSAVTVGNADLDPLKIKMILLYSTANDPGLVAVYNALKGRFNL